MSIVTLLSTSTSAEQFTFSRMKFSSSVSAAASTYAGQTQVNQHDAFDCLSGANCLLVGFIDHGIACFEPAQLAIRSVSQSLTNAC